MPKGKNKQVERKVIVSLLLLNVYLWLPMEYVPELAASFNAAWYTHLCSQWAHTGLFHLILNLYVLWFLRFTWKEFGVAYLVSIPATFASSSGAIGFSSVIYALMGLLLPQVRLSVRDWVLFLVVNAATAFVPPIAFGVHVTAFGLGFLAAKIKKLSDEYRRACKRG